MAGAPRGSGVTDVSNAVQFINQFNRTSLFIANLICSTEKLKERVVVFGRVVQLCGYLYHMGNFNGLKACLAGLSMAPVYRLSHTKSAVGKKVSFFLSLSHSLLF